jgi:long-chain acyl-CoA synthetase
VTRIDQRPQTFYFRDSAISGSILIMKAEFMSTGAFGLLNRVAQEVPDRIAIIQPFESRITFGEWRRRSLAFAARLGEAGIRSGMRIGLVFDRADWIKLAVAYFAVQRLGAITVTVSADTPAAALRFISADAKLAAWVVADNEALPEGIQRYGIPVHAVDDAGHELYNVPEFSPRPDEPADILYTSGTTGIPKGVVTPHGLLSEVYAEPPTASGAVGPPILHCFPPGTSAALMMIFAPFQGVPSDDGHPITRAVATLPQFTVDALCLAVERLGVNLAFLVPATVAHLTRLSDAQRHRLRTLDAIHCGSAPLNPSHAAIVNRLLPAAQLINAYGSTEMWPAMLSTRFSETAADALGRPGEDTAVRIRSLETGRIVESGRAGSVEVMSLRTRYRRSYLHDEEPSSTYRSDGWIVTGDVGHLDTSGSLHLSGRVADLLNVGGEKIPSRPIEVALLAHRAVRSAAVVGLPHPRLGEYCAAFVVLDCSDLSINELRDHLLRHLAPKLVPRRIFALEQLPLTHNGKVLKRTLAQMAIRADDALVELR